MVSRGVMRKTGRRKKNYGTCSSRGLILLRANVRLRQCNLLRQTLYLLIQAVDQKILSALFRFGFLWDAKLGGAVRGKAKDDESDDENT